MFPLGSTNAFLVVCDNMMILKPTSFFICCFYFIKKVLAPDQPLSLSTACHRSAEYPYLPSTTCSTQRQPWKGNCCILTLNFKRFVIFKWLCLNIYFLCCFICYLFSVRLSWRIRPLVARVASRYDAWSQITKLAFKTFPWTNWWWRSRKRSVYEK